MDNLNTETPPQEAPQNTGSVPSTPAFPSEDDYAAFSPEQRKDFMAEKPEKQAPAAAPEKKEPETKAEPKDDDDPEEVVVAEDGRVRDTKGRFVPVEAYTKVKGKLKTINEELTKERESRAKLEGRTDELSKIIGLLPKIEQKQEQQAEEAKPIDPETDVIGAVKLLLENQQKIEKRITEGDTKSQEKQAHDQLLTNYAADVKGALKDHPDLGDAYGHVKNVQRAILAARGITDAGTQEILIEKAERGLVEDMLKAGKSPSRAIYEMAIAQGYQKKAPAAAAPAAPEKTEAQEKIERLKENMAAVGSLSSASGTGTPSENIDITKMTEDELYDLKQRLGSAKWNKLLGG